MYESPGPSHLKKQFPSNPLFQLASSGVQQNTDMSGKSRLKVIVMTTLADTKLR